MTYYGKYRAKVTDLGDPEQRGRIRVECPSVLGTSKSSWCEPCSPVAYDGGGDFCMPKVGDTVWVEFEEGDANKPIWVGNWWSKSKSPISYGSVADIRVIEYHGAKITMSGGAMTITAGGVTLSLSKGVCSISGALVVNGSTINLNGGDVSITGTINLN